MHAIFSKGEIARVARFFAGRRKPESARVFFRAQLLELMQWIASHCNDMPDDGATFERADVRQAFAKAALIAGELWGKRVFDGKLEDKPDRKASRRQALGAFRIGTEADSLGTDPLLAIGRGRSLFLEHLHKIRGSVGNEFRAASGLSLESFYGLLATIATHYLLRVDLEDSCPQRSGLFHEKNFLARPTFASAFQHYVSFACQSPDEMRVAVPATIDSASVVTDHCSWMSHLKRRPILRTSDGRCIVADPVAFSEHASAGPLFAILPGKSQTEVNQCFSDFGLAFERYANSILRRMYPTPPTPLVDRLACDVPGVKKDGTAVQVADASLSDGQDVALFEMKAVWLAERHADAADPYEYVKQVDALYVSAGRDGRRPKGAGQLANSIAKIASGEWVPTRFDLSVNGTIYPILVCYDTRLRVAGHPWHLAEQFRSALNADVESTTHELVKSGLRVANLVVITIEDLEILETSIEHFGLMELIRDYVRACPERLCSLHDYIATSNYQNKIFANRDLARSALEALEAARVLMGAESSR
ncbi:MAG: hypothetical protein WD063_19400 [Pirellulales bacterium]